MTPDQKQHVEEMSRYEAVYQTVPLYGMGWDRFKAAVKLLQDLPSYYESILDVGCGRGELLRAAYALGFQRIQGTEVVENLALDEHVERADIAYLPFADNSFETVCCFDVLEHLVEHMLERAIKELARVASRRVLISVSNISSKYGELGELHITRKDYDEWCRLITNIMEPLGWFVRERPEVSDRVSYFVEALRHADSTKTNT